MTELTNAANTLINDYKRNHPGQTQYVTSLRDSNLSSIQICTRLGLVLPSLLDIKQSLEAKRSPVTNNTLTSIQSFSNTNSPSSLTTHPVFEASNVGSNGYQHSLTYKRVSDQPSTNLSINFLVHLNGLGGIQGIGESNFYSKVMEPKTNLSNGNVDKTIPTSDTVEDDRKGLKENRVRRTFTDGPPDNGSVDRSGKNGLVHSESKSRSPRPRSRSPRFRSRSPRPRNRRLVTPPRNRRSVTPPRNRRSVTPPRNRRSVTPPRNRRSVTPPRHRRSVTPPRNRRSVTPPRNRRSVTPPRHRRSVTPPRNRRSVTPPRKRHSVTPPRNMPSWKPNDVSSSSNKNQPQPATSRRGSNSRRASIAKNDVQSKKGSKSKQNSPKSLKPKTVPNIQDNGAIIYPGDLKSLSMDVKEFQSSVFSMVSKREQTLLEIGDDCIIARPNRKKRIISPTSQPESSSAQIGPSGIASNEVSSSTGIMGTSAPTNIERHTSQPALTLPIPTTLSTPPSVSNTPSRKSPFKLGDSTPAGSRLPISTELTTSTMTGQNNGTRLNISTSFNSSVAKTQPPLSTSHGTDNKAITSAKTPFTMPIISTTFGSAPQPVTKSAATGSFKDALLKGSELPKGSKTIVTIATAFDSASQPKSKIATEKPSASDLTENHVESLRAKVAASIKAKNHSQSSIESFSSIPIWQGNFQVKLQNNLHLSIPIRFQSHGNMQVNPDYVRYLNPDQLVVSNFVYMNDAIFSNLVKIKTESKCQHQLQKLMECFKKYSRCATLQFDDSDNGNENEFYSQLTELSTRDEPMEPEVEYSLTSPTFSRYQTKFTQSIMKFVSVLQKRFSHISIATIFPLLLKYAILADPHGLCFDLPPVEPSTIGMYDLSIACERLVLEMKSKFLKQNESTTMTVSNEIQEEMQVDIPYDPYDREIDDHDEVAHKRSQRPFNQELVDTSFVDNGVNDSVIREEVSVDLPFDIRMTTQNTDIDSRLVTNPLNHSVHGIGKNIVIQGPPVTELSRSKDISRRLFEMDSEEEEFTTNTPLDLSNLNTVEIPKRMSSNDSDELSSKRMKLNDGSMTPPVNEPLQSVYEPKAMDLQMVEELDSLSDCTVDDGDSESDSSIGLARSIGESSSVANRTLDSRPVTPHSEPSNLEPIPIDEQRFKHNHPLEPSNTVTVIEEDEDSDCCIIEDPVILAKYLKSPKATVQDPVNTKAEPFLNKKTSVEHQYQNQLISQYKDIIASSRPSVTGDGASTANQTIQSGFFFR
ncbi:hypothetical protein HDV02_005058 [Globomyces sp. JEL0801]|nr:hypothetical protein HDV02_005058 [Globomyces sp. JEL0801]